MESGDESEVLAAAPMGIEMECGHCIIWAVGLYTLGFDSRRIILLHDQVRCRPAKDEIFRPPMSLYFEDMALGTVDKMGSGSLGLSWESD